jgi:DNA-binding MarR family transcriptional regulator
MQHPRRDREQLVEDLVDLSQSMRRLRGLARSPWPNLDLSMSQFKVLMMLVLTGGLMGRELAERLGVGASAVTPLVDKLVKEKLARREPDPTDRRVTWIRPTAQAQKLSERVQAVNRSVFGEIADAVPDSEVAEVRAALAKLLVAASGVFREAASPDPHDRADARTSARHTTRAHRAHARATDRSAR